MSRNLATKASLDHPVLLWTRTLAKAHAHSAAVPNTAVAASPAEAVRAADIIWSCLGDDDAVVAVYNDVLGDADAADLAGKLFVECSTINPESTEELARRILERGGEFVAMPGACMSFFPSLWKRWCEVMVVQGQRGGERLMCLCSVRRAKYGSFGGSDVRSRGQEGERGESEAISCGRVRVSFPFLNLTIVLLQRDGCVRDIELTD